MASTLESGPAGKSSAKTGALPDAKMVECERFIEAQLGATRGQVKGVEIATATLKLVVGVLAYLSLVVVVDHWVLPGGLGFLTRSLALLALLGGGGWYLATRVLPLLGKRVNPVYAAYSIEKSQPTLKNSVINFLLLRRERERVSDPIFVAIEQRAASDLQRVPVEGTVDRSGLIRLGYVLVGLVTLVCAYWLLSPKDPWRTFRRVATPWADVAPATRVTIDLIEPGSTRVFQGESVRVTARVRGVRKREEVTLFWSTADGQNVDQPIAMQPSAEGYASYFEAEVPGGSGTLQQNTEYYLRAGDAESPRFRLEVVTAPAILVERVEYAYPAYADVQNRIVQRQGDLQGIDGTTVTITARANVPIKSAHIDFDADGGRDLPLSLAGQVATGSFVLSLNKQGEPQNKNYQVRFLDAAGHENPHPVRHTIEVLPDQPPEIEFTEPGQDEVELALNGALPLALRARDRDFKLRRVTVFFEKKGSAKLRSEVLLDEPRGGQFDGSLVFDASTLEPGAVAAGDTIEYWAEARDNRHPVANEAHTVKHRIRVISPVDEAERQRQVAEAEKKAKEAAAREAEQAVAGDDPAGEDEQSPAGEETEVASTTPPEGAEAAKPSTERKDPEREAAEAMEDILAYRDEQSGDQPPDDAPPRDDQTNKPNDQTPDSAEQPQAGDPNGDDQEGADQADTKQKPVDADHSGDNSSKPQDAASKPPQSPSEKPDGQPGEPQQGDPQEGEEQGSGDQGDESQQPGGQSGDQSGSESGGQEGGASGQGEGKPKPQSGSDASGEQSSGEQSSGGTGGKPRPGQKPGGSGEGNAEPDSASPDSGSTEKPTRSKPGARKPGAKQPKPQSTDSAEPGEQEGASPDGAAQPDAKPKPKPGSKPTKPESTKPNSAAKPQPGDQPGEEGGVEGGAEPGAQQQPGQDPSADSSQEGTGRQGDRPGQSSERQPGANATEGGSPQQGGKPPAGRKPKKPQQASPQADGESPTEAAAEATKPSGGKPKADKPKPEEGEGESAAASKPQSQDNPGEQGSGAGAGDRSAPPAGEERDKPPSEEEERHDQEATGGDPNNSQGESGAGQQPENHKPSGRMDQQQGTKQKNQQSNSETDPSNDDVGDNASSPKPLESDSQGAESGDRQGGGQQGGGQKAKKPGTGSAGENTASDQGGGEAEGAGDGNASDQAGNKTPGKQPRQGEGQKTDGAGSSGESSEPQGDSGSPSSSGQSGGGAAGRKPPQSSAKPRQPKSPQGQKPEGGSGEQPNKPSKPEAGERGPTPEPNQPNSSSGGDVGSTNGAPGAGVMEGDGRPPAPGQAGAAPPQEALGGEEANAEFARKQTDLVIDSLKNQLADNEVDPELLKKLGWSREDVEKFVRRWEALRKAAGQVGAAGDEARQQYERVISDLNLKRRGVSIRQTAKPDQVNRLRESRGTKPPVEYADQFRAYTEGASKAAAPKGK